MKWMKMNLFQARDSMAERSVHGFETKRHVNDLKMEW